MSFCPACGASVDGRFCPKCGNAAAVPAGADLTVAPANAGLTENAAGALCYLGGLITGILFLVLAPYSQNPRVKFHAFQAILFHVAWVMAWLIMIPVGMFLPFGLSVLMSLLSLVVWGGGLLLWLFLMWKAYQGQTVSLPVIGAIARQQAGK